MPRVTIHSDGQMSYRTKLMTFAQAKGFAKCLDGNSRYHEVMVLTSQKAKADKCHYVQFAPVNRERVKDMYVAQYESRERRGIEEGANYLFFRDTDKRLWWVFNPLSGETYEVSPGECSCPDYQYRCRAASILCKHMHAVSAAVDAGKISADYSKESREQFRARIIESANIDF